MSITSATKNSKELREKALATLPFIEEICPYGETIGSFLDKRELIVDGKVTEFLVQQGLMSEFLDFRRAEMANRMNAWFEDKGFKCSWK
ncbi:MAG: hypothetical protein UHS49_01905 [Faecalimonas sp.]|nr:hypothetical protein [Faecalimonas sp.]